MNDTNEHQAARRVATGLCLVALVAGLLVIFGWAVDSRLLKSFVPNAITMKANTALCFVLLAMATLFVQHPGGARLPWRAAAHVCLGLVLAVTLATLIEYATGWDAHIDELLFRDFDGLGGRFPPGRLAPMTAVAFWLLALGRVSERFRAPWARRLSPVLAILAGFLSFQALLGFLLGLHYTFGKAYYTQMALHTAVLFILLAVAQLLARPEAGFMRILLGRNAVGAMARRLLLAALLVPGAIDWAQNLAQAADLFSADFGIMVKVLGNTVVFSWLIVKSTTALEQIDAERRTAEAQAQADYLRRRLAQEATQMIEASERRLRQIFQSAFDAVIGINADGCVTDWNSKAEAIFGWTRGEAIGQSFAAMVLAEDQRAAHNAAIARFLAGGDRGLFDKSVEISALRRNGEAFPVQMALTAVEQSKQDSAALTNIWEFTAFIADITERKRNTEELVRAREAALQAANAKTEFLANMSHEIRTPLNGIIGMTDLLLLNPATAEERLKFTRIIQESGNHLLTIVNDILDFAKIEAGRMELETSDFSVANLIEAQLGLFSKKIADKQLQAHAVIDASLPALLHGDSGRLAQVLMNLLSNAIKFTDEGSITIRVAVDAASKQTIIVRFSVEDTGMGLSPADAKKLFQPFVQASQSTARIFGGTGLGLSICKKLVELMGGTVGVDSEIGKGARFWFRLPLQPGHNALARAPATLSPLPSVRSDTAPLCRILVAEDNTVNQMIVLAVLAKLGYQAQAVGDGNEAIAALEQAPFDAVLMDCQMPHLDGYEATRRIRAHSDRRLAVLPIIALTANAMQADQERCLAAGMNAFLTKPINRQQLDDVLRQFLSAPASLAG